MAEYIMNADVVYDKRASKEQNQKKKSVGRRLFIYMKESLMMYAEMMYSRPMAARYEEVHFEK